MCYIDCGRMWKITPQPKCWLSFWEIWCGFFPRNHFVIRGFSPWTASGFYPWGNVVSPLERVAEGLGGWRHGNPFSMTQSAQSLRQMRSIPHRSKAVFYVFVFDYIHNSATLHNLSPGIFHWTGIGIYFNRSVSRNSINANRTKNCSYRHRRCL